MGQPRLLLPQNKSAGDSEGTLWRLKNPWERYVLMPCICRSDVTWRCSAQRLVCLLYFSLFIFFHVLSLFLCFLFSERKEASISQYKYGLMAYIPRLLRGPKRSKDDCNLWPNLGSTWLNKKVREVESLNPNAFLYIPMNEETEPSTHHTPQSTLHTSHSTLYTSRSILYTLYTLCTMHSTLYTIYTLRAIQTAFAPYGLHICTALYTLNSTLYALHSSIHTLHSTPYTLYTPYALHTHSVHKSIFATLEN